MSIYEIWRDLWLFPETMEAQVVPFLKHLTTKLRKVEHTNWRRLNGNLHNPKVINKHLLSSCYMHRAQQILIWTRLMNALATYVQVLMVQSGIWSAWVLKGLTNCWEKQEARKGQLCTWEQGRCQKLQAAVQFSPSTREAGRGEKPQEGNLVIWVHLQTCGLWATCRRVPGRSHCQPTFSWPTPEQSFQSLWRWASGSALRIHRWFVCTLKFLNRALDENASVR